MAQSDPIRGKAPAVEPNTKQFSIRDHNEDEVAIVWSLAVNPNEQLPPFPFQVYLLSSASGVADNEDFPSNFASFIGQIAEQTKCRNHFQIYRRPFPNILACIAHQRREILFRNRNGIVPRMVARWTQRGFLDKGQILVIDTDDWLDSGVTFVSFDPARHDHNGGIDDHWSTVKLGDDDTVHASRVRGIFQIRNDLFIHWTNAGRTWTEEDLERRNDGSASPVLYPAIDPAAHQDAEQDDVHELDGTALSGPAPQTNINFMDLIMTRIIDTFDRAQLFRKEHELNDLQSESYSDNLGLPVTSVWHAQKSRLRPPFSFTLYLAYDLFDKFPIRQKALFGCLNKGLIAQEAWTLDIVQNMPSLDAAYQYHTLATAQRTPEGVARRRKCMDMIVRKIAEPKLPSELLEHITNLLVPPEIPRYSSRPCRPFKDVFLYLEKSRQYTGPLIIYSNPDTFWLEHNRSAWPEGEKGPTYYSGHPSGMRVKEAVLRVVFQRFWHRVADELHVLWSLCSPRCEIPSIPRVKLELMVPEACVWRSAFGPQYVNGHVDVKLTLHSDQDITVHCNRTMFSCGLWEEAVEVIDIETGEIIPPLCHGAKNEPICLDSWAYTRELGFKVGDDQGLDVDPATKFRTFKANTSCKLGMRPNHSWWRERVCHGIHQNGRQYAFRLKPGLVIPRWTYGTFGDLKGPYNLPPIPVTVDETLRPFAFRVESVGAPHGSFNR